MNKFIAKVAFAGILLTTVLVACEKEYATIQQEDAEDISGYIKTNNLSMTEYIDPATNKGSGIFYQVLEQGTGDVVSNTDIVFVTYTLKSFDGLSSYTDESKNRFTSYLGYLDKKNMGLPSAFGVAVKDILKKKGGKVRVIIPSNQAYGIGGASLNSFPFLFKIEGNQSLDCVITLHNASNVVDFEDILVQRYIKANNITGLTKTASGLYYQIIEPGTGTTEVLPYSNISTAYTVKLTNGTIFNEVKSSDPYKVRLSDFPVLGGQEGLLLIKKGGKIRLVIPPQLAYGSTGTTTGIPAYSILDFNIELLDVTN